MRENGSVGTNKDSILIEVPCGWIRQKLNNLLLTDDLLILHKKERG